MNKETHTEMLYGPGMAVKMAKEMERYYDHRSISCDGCVFDQEGEYPDGRPYKACRWYGYIFNPEKGVSQETCKARRGLGEEAAKTQGVHSMREMGKASK